MDQDAPVKGWDFILWKEKNMLSVLLAYIAALMAWGFWPSIWTMILFVVLLFVLLTVLYFFRNPSRQVINEPGLLIGPCDGKVVAIEREKESRYLNTEVIRISIFLNVNDVHVQRIPLGGKVSVVDHRPGKFLQAFRPEASDVNEYIAMQIETDYGTVLIKQIAGILARRCVNFADVGETVLTGQRFGLIKFSSRVDLFLPVDSDIIVSVGDRVVGGLTRVAQMSEAPMGGGK